MSSLYCHRRLTSERSIRLIRLFSGKQTDPVRCELFEVCLDDSPKCEALSYTWGSQVPDDLVLCEGRSLGVMRNCVAALRHLRYARKTRLLWVDAICIDQSQIPERNNQVKLMMKIYSNAKLAVVWVGEGSEETDVVFESLHSLNITLRLPSALFLDSLKKRVAMK